MAINPSIPCNQCDACLSGKGNLCENFTSIGGTADTIIDGTFVVEVDGQRPVNEGEELYATIPAETVYRFDTESGDAIHHRSLTKEAELSNRMAEVGVISEESHQWSKYEKI